MNFLSNEIKLAHFNIKGYPVNQNIYLYNCSQQKYDTEKEHDEKHPKTFHLWEKCWKELVADSLGWIGLEFLETCRKSPYFSKYDMINEEGNLVKDISRFFLKKKNLNKHNTNDELTKEK